MKRDTIQVIGFILFISLSISNSVFATQWNVGPTRTYTTPSAVSNLVNDGDTILIDAALYANHPQVQFSQDNLFITGIGGRPRLEAGASLANNSNGKAIFVISGSNCRIDNIEFANAVVPDNNGAGIRQEGCDLTVTNCYFIGNEMGLLGGNLGTCTVRMEHNVFLSNGSSANPGYQHNVYIGSIDSLIFRFNYSINAIAEGHELKSRAGNNIIMYNYIANLDTEDSRTIDLPNGGTVIMVGNIIVQGPASANSNIIGYGQEGLVNDAPHNVWMSNNTIVNNKTTGNFIQVANGTDTLFLKNNIMVGAKTSGLILGSPALLDSSNNLVDDDVAVAEFVSVLSHDYHLEENSPAINQGILIDQWVGNYSLHADLEYADTALYASRYNDDLPDIGAFEFVPVTSVDDQTARAVSFYPNPCTDVLYMTGIPEHTAYQIYNVQGHYVQGGIVIGGAVDVRKILGGVYVMTLGGSGSLFIKD